MLYSKTARQRNENQSSIGKKLALVCTGQTAVLVGIGVAIGAVLGIITSYIISPIPGLSPLIIGGMIGAQLPLSLPLLLFLSFLPVTTYFKSKPEDRAKETIKATIITIIAIAVLGVYFGIGAGLAALGFTSPAAIGALTTVVSAVCLLPLILLIDKAAERFSSRKSEQPSEVLGEGVKTNPAHPSEKEFRCAYPF